MFGKDSSITDQECAPTYFPDFREVLSTDPEVRWTDRVHPDGTWEANLLQFYLRVWPRLSARLPKPFQIKGGRRQDETPAHIALREAFVNALIHADYSAPGNLLIESKMEAFQFINPGTLLVSLRQYYQGGVSECRNVSLQKMFVMMGGAERAGSGVNKILYGWEYAHWRKPYLELYSHPDRVVLELSMTSLLPDETLHSLRELYGPEVDTLGKDELTILVTCHIEGDITNSRLQYMIDRHRTDITKILQELCKKGYLLSDNKGRWTSYHLNTEGKKTYVDTSDSTEATSDPNDDTSDPNDDTLDPNDDTSDPNDDTSRKIPQRLPVEKLRSIIIETCRNRYMTTEQIANAIGRTETHLKNRILPNLVQSGKLIRMYPDTPNHPSQAYKAIE